VTGIKKENRMKTRKQFFVMAIALIALAFACIACKHDEPQSVEQKLSVVVNSNVTVEIKFMALPNTTPSYMSKLQEALSWMSSDFGARTGTVTINVISGNTPPAKGVTKTLNVGSEWLSSNSSTDIYGGLTASGVIANWFTMIKSLKLA
jgi:ABC-type glycerol-3-phosphate transport system substrate-binding protein